MSSQKMRDLLSTATHAVGQAEAQAYQDIGEFPGQEFPKMRRRLNELLTERDELLRKLSGSAFKRVVEERDELQREVDGLHTICGEQRDELRQARNSYLHQRPTEPSAEHPYSHPVFQDMLREVGDLRNRDSMLVRERDDLRRRLGATERLVGTEQARLHTHLDAARKERDDLQRDLKRARQGDLSDVKVALRMKRDRDNLQRELDATVREVRRLNEQDTLLQLNYCRTHRDALQEQVGTAEGHRDALLHDMDMLEAQVRSRDNAIACLEGQVKHFAIAVRAVIHGSVT